MDEIEKGCQILIFGGNMLKETFECLKAEQCSVYLKKLGFDQNNKAADPDFLDQLIQRHLERIPFENLDLVWKHQSICTDLETVFHKIVEHERGGYCFELNALFLGLLRGLGYEAYPVACRILRRPTIGIPTHRASVVMLNGKKYFCDVGYGGIACNRAALLEENAVTETDYGSFRFEREYEGWLNQWFCPGDAGAEPIRIMMISECPSAPVDFADANRAMCLPESIFTQKAVVQKLIPDGSAAIDGGQFLVRKGKDKTIRQITSQEEAEQIVKEVFQIELMDSGRDVL